jgi:hypothetical protein
VLGEFPTSEDETVIPLELVLGAVGRNVSSLDYYPVWGVDIARFGDDRTALAKRQANKLLESFSPSQFRFLLEVLISSVITARGPVIALRTAIRPAEPPAEKTSSRRLRRKVARPGPPGGHAIRIGRLIRQV